MTETQKITEQEKAKKGQGNWLPTANREYKSRIFTMLYSEPERALELYNAVNNTNYDNPELLETNTLENAIYMGMKNDVSFVLDARMSLYEHQSTVNPNLPLRFLFYVADVYSLIKVCLEFGQSPENISAKLVEEFQMSREEAVRQVEEYFQH